MPAVAISAARSFSRPPPFSVMFFAKSEGNRTIKSPPSVVYASAFRQKDDSIGSLCATRSISSRHARKGLRTRFPSFSAAVFPDAAVGEDFCGATGFVACPGAGSCTVSAAGDGTATPPSATRSSSFAMRERSASLEVSIASSHILVSVSSATIRLTAFAFCMANSASSSSLQW